MSQLSEKRVGQELGGDALPKRRVIIGQTSLPESDQPNTDSAKK
ncbi:hypothetical protein PT974_01161 [Cladobotryum mycophilum]|uniref:Uncharacterized protein n=1 Tax=Cladobotryum mycophilum TaxID=491253 RepID=A0ABR0T2X1_9HYPO